MYTPLSEDEADLGIDVIMVWHAYQLNPRNFLEDCLRFGKIRLWHTGLPWGVINSCIQANEYKFVVPESTKQQFERIVGEPWENEDMPDTLQIPCPACQASNRVPWSLINNAITTFVSVVLDTGFVSKDFTAQCSGCNSMITHEKLHKARTRRDIIEAYKNGAPMAGTVLTLNGKFTPIKLSVEVC